MEISDPPSRRWGGLAAYGLLYLAVAVTLVVVFLKLSIPLALATAVVCFMVAYMLLMGWIAGGRLDRRE